MAWKEGLVIRGGRYSGATIGISSNLVGGSYAANIGGMNDSAGQQVQGDPNVWYNTDFDKMIDCSSIFGLSGADFSDECIADIAIMDGITLTGFWSLYATRNGLNVYVNGKIKNASGVVVNTFPQGASITIDGRVEPSCYLCLAKNTVNNYTLYGLYFNMNQHWEWAGQQFGLKAYAGCWLNDDRIYEFFGIPGHVDSEVKKKSPEFGPASEDGGYGPMGPGSGGTGGSGGPGPTFDGTSDPWVDTPTKPGVLSFGLLNLYKCDTGSLNLLGETLFPTIVKPPAPPQTGVTDWVKWSGEVAEWIGNVIFAVSDSIWNKDLIDYIVSVHLIPVDVTGGDLEDIKVGPRTLTGILARPITEDVIEFDCGTVHVDEYYTSYIDYTATRCRLYIPFYGMVTIKPEYWQSADLSLKYLWNVMDGSFIAKVYSTVTRHQSPCTTMIGQYSGSACVHMPLSGANYASMFSQLTGAAGGMAMGAASGNVAMAATSAMALPGALSTDMQTSNAYNASSAFYGHARPYLIIERAISHFPTNYSVEKGLPLLVTKTIGSCSGFTIAESPILDGIPATLEEKERIKQFLQNGVIIK